MKPNNADSRNMRGSNGGMLTGIGKRLYKKFCIRIQHTLFYETVNWLPSYLVIY